MAKSPTEQVREFSVEVAILKNRDAQREREVDRLRDELAEERKARTAIERDNAALRQQFLDHVAQYQERDRRQWQLFVLVVGAALSLATGLIVTLARK